jgi:hypothetical protein
MCLEVGPHNCSERFPEQMSLTKEGAKAILVLQNAHTQPALGPTLPAIRSGSSSEVKRPGREVKHVNLVQRL